MLSRQRLWLAMLAAGVALAAACGGGGTKSQPTPAPSPTPAASGPAEQALAAYVQTTLQKQFLEDCAKADVTNDTGKVCAAFQGERQGMRAYKIGLTFSEFDHWVIMGQNGGQWTVVASVPITFDTAAVPGVPWPLRTGVDVVVAGADPCVNVREGPSLNQKAVDCIPDGTKIRLAAGPTAADGINWWQVEGRSGWVAGDYLRYPDAIQ